MGNVNITINGFHVQVKSGTTVLQAAQQAGVEIPTLCQHPALENIGACRMCLVEVARSPRLEPACTYPAVEGLEVQTETPRVNQMRKFVLEMLFSERNHYCMYCEMSGDCELQALAYKYGLDHWTYPSPNKEFEVDGTRKYFMMDHNRCILCRRCVRACADLVANNTLGLKLRGAKTQISADMDVSFGESSCIECGTCLQVCPTGALVDRKSAYMGRSIQVERTASACTQCGVGCQTQVVTRAGHPLRVEGDWAGANGGVLCKKGRFDPIHEQQARVALPLIRKDGQLVETDYAKAIAAVAEKVKAAGAKGVKAWTTAGALSGTLEAFVQTFKEKLGAAVGIIEAAPEAAVLADGAMADLDKADVVLVAGGDPLEAAPVLGYRVKRAFGRKAQVILAADGTTGLDDYCSKKIALAQLDEAIAAAQAAAAPVVVADAGLSTEQIARLNALKGKARFIVMQPAANSIEAKALGLKNGLDSGKARVIIVMPGEAELAPETVVKLRKAEFLVVVAGVQSTLTAAADVVLPAPLWFEREGTFTNAEGRKMTVRRAAAPPEGIPSEAETLGQLAALV